MPLYLVVFIGFVGYSLMITVFTPLFLADDGGLLASSTSTAERTLVLGGVLAVDSEQQGSALSSNQSLQVGAEGVSGLAGGGLAAISTALPLPAMGVLALLGAGLLSRPAARETSGG